MNEQSNNEDAKDTLAEKVSRMAYSHGGRSIYCELFMLPVIALDGTPLLPSSEWGDVNQAVNEAIEKWFSRDSKVVLFSGVTPYDWVSTWTPKVLRAHLMRLLPKAEKTERIVFYSEDIALPTNAPRLGFITVACSTHRQWPSIPEADSGKDERLKSVIKLAIQIADKSQDPLSRPPSVVCTPERVRFAVADGICNWLNHLHEHVGITGYTATPSERNMDVIKVTLALKSQDVPLTQFLIRQHQIGNQGVQDVLAILHYMAPVMDWAADMTQNQNEDYRKKWS